ncbi:GDSL/SGNH-like acyl-esterase family found in Pmr5 and Cas1p-domain-containing protein [Gongronella butleri]|nr:GDSL/SGNH-like acyl-esterase family found in Pmr5 and Cas1p-domain-containing protein [Gongronella butleri]
MGASAPVFRSFVVYLISVASIIVSLVFIWAWRDSNLILPDAHRHVPDVTTSLDFVIDAPSHSFQCSSDTFNVGSWQRRPFPIEDHSQQAFEKAANYHCRHGFPHRCYRHGSEEEFNRSVEIASYEWKPSTCSLIDIDRRKLTDHLADHPLLLVGDSITQLQFESMFCLHGEDLQSTDANLTAGDRNVWANQLVHPRMAGQPGAVSLAYLRSDYLVRLDDFKLMDPFDNEGYLIGKGSNFPWIHALPKFTYIVINTGPHWHQDKKWGPKESDKELIDAFSKGMRKVFDYLKENIRSDQRVWVRSTPYGHAKCSQYKRPLDKPKVPNKGEGEYQWDLLESFDMIWKNWIEDENDIRFRFLNVSSMSNLRGDAHANPDGDCLHTCIPGPVDDWNNLLAHEIARVAAPISV